MTDNPYLSPQATSNAVPLAGREGLSQPQLERLIAIARAQKAVLACVPLSLALRVVFAATTDSPFEQPVPFICVTFAVALLTAACISRLAVMLYGTAWGLLAGFVALVPWLALFPLLIVVFRATATLTRHGILVGLAGAKLGRDPAF